jgi:putative DNA primase/helicase
MNRSELTWNEVEDITRGRLGETRAVCPFCSSGRRTALKRKSKVLAVNLREPDFAVFHCHNCDASGYCRPDATSSSRVIDFAERRRRREQTKRQAEQEKQDRTRKALELWDAAEPFRGSPAELYLRHSRGIGDWLDGFRLLDEALRFHPDCPFGDKRLPCMVALVRDVQTNVPVAVHRTALTADRYPKRIDRMSLGPTGGGAIKLSADNEVQFDLLIGEGIETVLSASKQLKVRPAWSLIDRNGVARFPALQGIEGVTVAVDNDASGDGQRAAAECVSRLTSSGVDVYAVKPTFVGDFNDVIRDCTRSTKFVARFTPRQISREAADFFM